ncbi:MAG: hypothetical protein WAL75_15845, partial [Terracidiphilus sp.]
HCTGSPAQAPAAGWTIDCRASDDAWPLAAATIASTPQTSGPIPNPAPSPPLSSIQSAALNVSPSQAEAVTASPEHTPTPAPQIRAFFNANRDYFTGVVSPGMGMDLPPFYSAAVLPRSSGTALLIGTIDGKILLASGGKLATVAGTSDWGSDFALIDSGCGTGAQIIASGTGNSTLGNPPADSLRAFQIIGSIATSASAPLAIDGTVTAIWPAPDGKSILAIIRNPQNQYEVDRVTALCN